MPHYQRSRNFWILSSYLRFNEHASNMQKECHEDSHLLKNGKSHWQTPQVQMSSYNLHSLLSDSKAKSRICQKEENEHFQSMKWYWNNLQLNHYVAP